MIRDDIVAALRRGVRQDAPGAGLVELKAERIRHWVQIEGKDRPGPMRRMCPHWYTTGPGFRCQICGASCLHRAYRRKRSHRRSA